LTTAAAASCRAGPKVSSVTACASPLPSGAVLSPLLSLSAASPCMGSGARMSCAMPLATGSDCASLADAPFSRMAVMA